MKFNLEHLGGIILLLFTTLEADEINQRCTIDKLNFGLILIDDLLTSIVVGIRLRINFRTVAQNSLLL